MYLILLYVIFYKKSTGNLVILSVNILTLNFMSSLNKINGLVEEILKTYPQTRNCDIKLCNTLWYKYNKNLIVMIDGDAFIPMKNLYYMLKPTTIIRIRQKFQKKGKYLPTEIDVRKKRGICEEEWRKYLGYNPELRQVYDN